MNALKRYSRTLFCSVGLIVTALIAGCGAGGDQGRDPILGLPAATLVSVAVTPATASIAISAAQQFVAVASYTDGSSRDVTTLSAWTSATPAVATVNATSGLAAGVSAGTSVVTATFSGKSGTAALTVRPATLVSIALSPLTPAINIAASQPFAVTGTFSDGTTRDITALSTFTSATIGVGTVNTATGLALGVSAGTSLISATSGGMTANTLLTVNPVTLVSIAVAPQAPTLLLGATRQLVVTATWSNGTTTDVTNFSTYATGTCACVSVSSAGLLKAISVGSSVVTATFSGKNAATTATVPSATLSSIAVTPATATVSVAGKQQFVATGTFSDGTTAVVTNSVAWTSANTAIGSVLNTGMATGATAGTTTITATSGSTSGSATLNVIAVTLSSIAVTPATATVSVLGTQQFVATGTFSDGTTSIITSGLVWTSGSNLVATVAATGVATGVAPGTAAITATSGTRSGSAALNVTAATLSSIAVTPATATAAVSGTQQFVATGTFSDGTTLVITNSVAWTSGSNLVATVANTGVATGVAPGTTAITATSGVRSGSASLTVTAAVIPPPVVNNPVNLRTAASFGVLAGTSITSNSGGTTLVTGDVGSPSQTTDPTQAAGFTNYKSGAILDGALADLQTAITDANGRTCGFPSPSGIDLGGLVLTPGVYCYSGSISITGTLILSGPGVYIFRTSTTLDTTANSVIQLVAGATADNITWVPVGATTLGANSVFKGSILGQSGAITAGDNATLLNGRVLSGAAVTLRNNQITK